MPQQPNQRSPRPPQDQVRPARRASCPACGQEYLTRSMTQEGCPYCGGRGIIRQDAGEFTKKVVDDNDLIK